MPPPITRSGQPYASTHLPDPEALLRSGAPRKGRGDPAATAPLGSRNRPSEPASPAAPRQPTNLPGARAGNSATEASSASTSLRESTRLAAPHSAHAGAALSRPAPMTPGELLGLTRPDPARAAMQALLPALRQLFPVEQEVFQSRATYGHGVIHRQDRGDDVFRMVAAIAGVEALTACVDHGPDLMRLAGWTPRQILNWSIQPNGINYLAVAAAEARRNPFSQAPTQTPMERGIAGLRRQHDAMASSGTPAQRSRAEDYRSELTSLRNRFERLQPDHASPPDPAERHDFRETIAALFERAENEHDTNVITGQDFRAVASHVMVWLSATDR
jgi:hypothetical protein